VHPLLVIRNLCFKSIPSVLRHLTEILGTFAIETFLGRPAPDQPSEIASYGMFSIARPCTIVLISHSLNLIFTGSRGVTLVSPLAFGPDNTSACRQLSIATSPVESHFIISQTDVLFFLGVVLTRLHLFDSPLNFSGAAEQLV